MSKSFKITSGLKLNIGKKSISTTIGKRGLSINTGSNGTFVNIAIPHTGIKYRKKLCTTKHKTIHKAKYFNNYQPHRSNTTKGAVILGSIIGGIIFLISNSLLWALVITFLISMLGIVISDKNTQKDNS